MANSLVLCYDSIVASCNADRFAVCKAPTATLFRRRGRFTLLPDLHEFSIHLETKQ